MNDSLHHENAKLRERVEVLEFEIAAMKSNIDQQGLVLKDKFGLTPAQARILAKLSDGRLLTRDWYVENSRAGDEMCESLLSVHIFRIRKKIAPLIIRTPNWSRAYQLEGDSLAAIRAVIGGEQ